jgi:hypothetical protein
MTSAFTASISPDILPEVSMRMARAELLDKSKSDEKAPFPIVTRT